MIEYVKGNIFDSDADCIFNTVNCEGFMGKGIAYQFKERFPDNNRQYVEYCKEGKLRPGVLLICTEKGKTIVNFPTKDKWRDPSKMQYISDGLDEFIRVLPELNIKKTAIPPLGCGNGGLDWSEVKRLIEDKLDACNIAIQLYEPTSSGKTYSQREHMTAYDLALLYVKGRLENASSLRFQKTFYFANYYFGAKLYVFSRGKYGPYSKDLYGAAEKIGIYRRNNGADNSKETYNAVYQTICSKKVDDILKKTLPALDKALSIVNDMTDDLLLEGSATALYLIKDERITKESDILKAFKEWSDDKANRFGNDLILKCLDYLEGKGIIQRNIFSEFEVL